VLDDPQRLRVAPPHVVPEAQRLHRCGRPRLIVHNGEPGAFEPSPASHPECGTAAVVLSNTARSVDRLGLRVLEAG